MQVKFIRERSLSFVGSRGLGTRVFAVGEIVELPEIHAQAYVADGDATVVHEKWAQAAPAEAPQEQPAARQEQPTEVAAEVEGDAPAASGKKPLFGKRNK